MNLRKCFGQQFIFIVKIEIRHKILRHGFKFQEKNSAVKI